jgi:hypothetical protein
MRTPTRFRRYATGIIDGWHQRSWLTTFASLPLTAAARMQLYQTAAALMRSSTAGRSPHRAEHPLHDILAHPFCCHMAAHRRQPLLAQRCLQGHQSETAPARCTNSTARRG